MKIKKINFYEKIEFLKLGVFKRVRKLHLFTFVTSKKNDKNNIKKLNKSYFLFYILRVKLFLSKHV